MERKHLILTITFLLSFQLHAQNLILNGSFEANNMENACALIVENAEGWEGINSIDLYNQNVNICHPQLNFSHYCGSTTVYGNYFIGMRVQKMYKEFILTKLATGLTKGEEYRFSMYVKARKGSMYFLKNFGISLSENYPGRKSESIFRTGLIGTVLNILFPYKKRTFYSSKNKKTLRNYDEWKQIVIDFTATGNEQFIVIGFFDINKKIQKSHSSQTPQDEAYYFIDNISLSKKNVLINEKGLNAIN